MTDCQTTLMETIAEISKGVCSHLNNLAPSAPWRERVKLWARHQRNPIRVKNLEKALAHLQVLQHFLKSTQVSPEYCEVLSTLVNQLKEPENISFNHAWEIADMLEGELLWVGDTNYIKCVWLTWPRSRVPDSFRDKVIGKDPDLGDRETVEGLIRPWLLEDQRDLVHEYRRDRAMISLRRSYLNVMAAVLLLLDLVFCFLFLYLQRSVPAASAAPVISETDGVEAEQPAEVEAESPVVTVEAEETAVVTQWELLLVVTSGAIGSVLARATRLSRQPLPSEAPTGKGQESPPLGIRALMSSGSVFGAQVMLGTTAALFVYLVFSSGLLGIEGLEGQTVATLAVLSFVAGFSEPFLLDVVGRIGGRVV